MEGLGSMLEELTDFLSPRYRYAVPLIQDERMVVLAAVMEEK